MIYIKKDFDMKKFFSKFSEVLKLVLIFVINLIKDWVGGLVLLLVGTLITFLMGTIAWLLMGYSGVKKFYESIFPK
jgi:sterol desaturase/sphingolipid hydroxylase (fatty acid hydroxylase superfamily)